MLHHSAPLLVKCPVPSRALLRDGLPPKHDLFGVSVSQTSYEEATALVMQAAKERRPMLVDHMPVHGLIEACQDSSLNEKMRHFDIVAPDGQPVRWALNRFYGAGLSDRVYGPALMLRLCRQAEREGVGVYLYGSQQAVLEQLQDNLLRQFPKLRIVGAESPPFRPLTAEEDQAAVERINDSGAGLIFLGLGCPKQEHFAYDHRDRINGVQLCVGAAFDFHAGCKKMAPKWMQRNGLEWAFRLMTEPGRLWRRYFRTNSHFLLKILRHELGI
ncbi:MAG: glycosyltransferase [Candidatus Moraniibacteriota bacterium]|nr:MAG: glycosyltransferase [Candidatus Moranbacteria bacterium]